MTPYYSREENTLINVLSQKLPVPVLLRGVLERCFTPERIDRLFERHAQSQYTQQLLFSTVCELLLHVVLRVKPSLYAAYREKEAALEVSAAALYDKAKGVELGVSAALVRETAQDLAAIVDALGTRREEWLPGYRVRVLDGNCLEGSEKRLAVQRGQSGAALPGKALVVMDAERGLLIDVFPCEDAYAQERSLLDRVLPTVQAGDCWVADRNFCVSGFLQGIEARGAYFLFRLHAGLPFREAGDWSEAVMTAEGQRISEQPVVVDGRRYRRIRVELASPTRDGDWAIDLLSNLPDTVSALDLAALYRRRWRLETAFQKLEAHLESEINTLAYPKAALLGFCLALVAYNAFEVLLAAIDAAQDEPVSPTLSTYYLAHQIAATFLALLTLTESEDWHFIGTLSPAEFAQWLRDTAAHINIRQYRKTPRGPKKPPPKKSYDAKQPHFSTQRLLQGKTKGTP